MAIGAAAQLGYLPAWMKTQLEHPLHGSSGLPAPTWQRCFNIPFFSFHPYFADTSIKLNKNENPKTDFKSPNMNIKLLAFFILMLQQAEHQGKVGGSTCKERQSANRSHKEEIKTQTKTHNRQDQPQKRQIQETGSHELDR